MLIIAFVFILMVCIVSPQYYFLLGLGGLALAVFRPKQSGFTDGDAEDLKRGRVLDADGRYIDISTVSKDLDSSADIDALFAKPQVTGDDLLLRQMQNVAGQTKDAILARARFTSDNFRRYFQEELDAAEQQHWWEDDSLVEGTVKDGRHHESDIAEE